MINKGQKRSRIKFWRKYEQRENKQKKISFVNGLKLKEKL